MRPTRSVRREIFAGFAAMLLALAAVGGYAVARQARTATALRLQNQGYLPLSVLLADVHANQTLMGTLLERVLTERDRAPSRVWIASARRTRRGVVARARGLAASARGDAREGPDGALLERVDAALVAVERAYREDEPQFVALFDALSRGAGDAPPRSDAAALHRALLAREQHAADRLQDAARALQERLSELATEAGAAQQRTLRVLALATALALAVGVFTLWSARRALEPLALLLARVRSVAAGDLAHRAVPARDDELGELAREFEKMVGAVDQRDRALRTQADAIARAERHLEQVVATLRSAVLVVSPEGLVRSANRAAEALRDGADPGAASASALRDAAFDATPFGALEGVAAAVRSVRAGGSSGASFFALRLGARALDVLVVPFAEPGVEGAGALVVADDVTERESARARLLQHERLAAIGRMAAHVTHEVRNPLSSMALNAEMLADEVRALGHDAAEPQRLVSAIQREIDRLTAITEEYLRVARLPRPRLEPEDLAALVAETASFARPELERAGVELRVLDRGDAPAVLLDEAQLRQALLNLLRNAREAVEARPPGRPARVTLRVGAAQGGAELRVCDTGGGVPRELRAQLFELFFTTKERGSGLGLALTREVVRAHGGRLEVGDAPDEDGGGAMFVLWLPAADGALASGAAARPVDQDAGAAPDDAE